MGRSFEGPHKYHSPKHGANTHNSINDLLGVNTHAAGSGQHYDIGADAYRSLMTNVLSGYVGELPKFDLVTREWVCPKSAGQNLVEAPVNTEDSGQDVRIVTGTIREITTPQPVIEVEEVR